MGEGGKRESVGDVWGRSCGVGAVWDKDGMGWGAVEKGVTRGRKGVDHEAGVVWGTGYGAEMVRGKGAGTVWGSLSSPAVTQPLTAPVCTALGPRGRADPTVGQSSSHAGDILGHPRGWIPQPPSSRPDCSGVGKGPRGLGGSGETSPTLESSVSSSPKAMLQGEGGGGSVTAP